MVKRGRWALPLPWLASFVLAVYAESQTAPSGRGALTARELVGNVWLVPPKGQKIPMTVKTPAGEGARLITDKQSVAVVRWFPYGALVKMAPQTEVALQANRTLRIVQGRVWIGSPPPPPPYRRYPLPVSAGDLLVIGSHEAIFSVVVTPRRACLVSVDEGQCDIVMPSGPVRVLAGMMALVAPNLPRPMVSPVSEKERLLWDAGGF